MARARALALVAAAALAAGCGGGSKASTPTQSTPTTSQPQQQQRDPTLPPKRVPQRATGPADKESVRVIRAWSKALRAGHVQRAARYFALPSKFQNATPVLTINVPQERLAIQEALPCGAVPTKVGGAGSFTIVTFKLTPRRGALCGSGVGSKARTAIRVARHKIREWYRLPDQEPPPSPNPSSSSGSDSGVA
jgi:hypothetical protein